MLVRLDFALPNFGVGQIDHCDRLQYENISVFADLGTTSVRSTNKPTSSAPTLLLLHGGKVEAPCLESTLQYDYMNRKGNGGAQMAMVVL